MTTPPFAHLHCHSHYSLLDGASPIDELVARAKELGMNALAITDHGNLYGALEFYTACRDAGINPIIGYEAYVAPGSRFEQERGRAGRIELPSHAASRQPHRISKIWSSSLAKRFWRVFITSRGLIANCWPPTTKGSFA